MIGCARRLLEQAAQLLVRQKIALEDALLKELLVSRGLVLLLLLLGHLLLLLVLLLLLLILLLELGSEEPNQVTVVVGFLEHLLVLLASGDIVDRVDAFIRRLLAYLGDQLELLLRDLLLYLLRGEDGRRRSLLGIERAWGREEVLILMSIAQVLRLRHILLHHLVDVVLVFKVGHCKILCSRCLLQEVAA